MEDKPRYRHSEATKAKMRAAQAQRGPCSDETRARISEGVRAAQSRPEVRARMSEAARNRTGNYAPLSDQHRQKISEAQIVRWSDSEERRKQSERRKGKPLSEAHKQALRDTWAAKRAAKEKQS